MEKISSFFYQEIFKTQTYTTSSNLNGLAVFSKAFKNHRLPKQSKNTYRKPLFIVRARDIQSSACIPETPEFPQNHKRMKLYNHHNHNHLFAIYFPILSILKAGNQKYLNILI
jgi:hypothetical protein